MVPSSLEPCALALLHEGTLVRDSSRPDISLCGECRIAKGLHLGSTKPNRNVNGKRGSTENAFTFASVMAGHHCCSARAFAVNPSRLPARPSGLRGLTAQRGQARRSAVPSMQNCAHASLLKRRKRKNVDREKPLDSWAPHISFQRGHARTRPYHPFENRSYP